MVNLEAILPLPIEDSVSEAEFLSEYRDAGIVALKFALSVAVVSYFAFAILAAVETGSIAYGFRARLLPLCSLLFALMCIWVFPVTVRTYYVPLLAIMAVLLFVGSSTSWRDLRPSPSEAFAAPPTLIALWILFGFFRLPLGVLLSVGFFCTAFALFSGSRVTNMPDPLARTLVYFAMANILGFFLARSIEVRERQLFVQRRIAEMAQFELLRRSQLAENASIAKTQLLAAVGHDLRQPLMAAALHSGVMSKKLNDGDIEGAYIQAQRVASAVELLGSTTEQLLDAARYETMTEELQTQSVSLRALFMTLHDLAEAPARQNGVDLRLRLPPADVMSDTNGPAMLRVLMNLISNAIKFSRKENGSTPVVLVRVVSRQLTLEINVIDNGTGIAPSEMERIWKPFYQIDGRTRDGSKGVGLGLFLIQQIVGRLQGHTISVRSIQGVGSRFVVSVPRTQVGDKLSLPDPVSEVALPHSESAELALNSLRGMYVLLVVQDADSLCRLETDLDGMGVLYSSGSDAISVLQVHGTTERTVDAIIVDFRICVDGDGIGFIGAIRSVIGNTPDAILVATEFGADGLIGCLPKGSILVAWPSELTLLRDQLARSLNSSMARERAI